MTAVVQTSAGLFAGEEALLEAYDLQWKAIDIRVERLRNECERMLLEYEVEMKQKMYLRECEDLLRLSSAQKEQQQAELQRELKRSDRQLDEKPTSTQKKPTEKETRHKPEPESSDDQPPAKTVKRKPAVEKPVKTKVKSTTSSTTVKATARQLEKETDLSSVADDDLLQMLSHDQEYESEDFNGDAPPQRLSLIHPDSQAMLSPNRLKKHKDEQKSRLMVAARMKMMEADSSSEPASEPEPKSFTSSDSSPSPMVELQEKRALKRRKTAVLGPETTKTGKKVAAVKATKATTTGKKSSADDKLASITGRSKARETVKVTSAALRAHAEEEARKMVGLSAIQDISTPTVPRKKAVTDAKQKRQQTEASTARKIEVEDDSAPGKKRHRPQENSDNFETPKKAKKAKRKSNQFANDELNIMKSPMPMLRAKLAERKRHEEKEKQKQKKNKRPRQEVEDDEDPVYDVPARAMPASLVLSSERLPAPISIKPASTFGLNPKKPKADEVAIAASDYAARWLNSGLVTHTKKSASKKGASKSPKPAALWGGSSFFDAFVNSSTTVIPRLKSTSTIPKSSTGTIARAKSSSSTVPKY